MTNMADATRFTLLTILLASLSVSCCKHPLNQNVSSANKSDSDSHMLDSNTVSSWTDFLHLAQKIKKIDSKKQLDSAQDWLASWRSSSDGTATEAEVIKVRTAIRKNQFLILNDELSRKKSVLRNKPGRQPRTDWIASLNTHTNRLQAELYLLNLPIFDTPDLQEVNSYLRKSLAFSDQLLDADIDQVTRRVSEGEYSSAPDIDKLLALAESLRKEVQQFAE